MNEQENLISRRLFDRAVPEETLDEWTVRTAAPKPTAATGKVSVFLVRAGGEWIGLPAGIIESAHPAGPIHTVPFFSSQAFPGLVNVSGELLPCVRLSALIEADPCDAPARPRLVAVDVDEGRFALLVDEAAGTRGCAPDGFSPPPETLSRSKRTPHPIVTAMAQVDGRTAGIADRARLGAALLASLRP